MSGVLNPVVMRITFRATMSRKRALLFAIPAVLLLGISGLLKATQPAATQWAPTFLGTFGFSVVLPLTALIIGISVLGAEIDDGSVIHLLATPVRRSTVVFSKFAVAVILTIVFAALPELLAGLIATGPSKLTAGIFAGALAAAVIYNAIFVMVSVLTTRAIAVGLLYLVVWEGLLVNLVSGASELSAGQYSLGIANAIAHDSNLNAHLSLTTAVVLGVIVTAVTLTLAVRALSSFSLKGDAV